MAIDSPVPRRACSFDGAVCHQYELQEWGSGAYLSPLIHPWPHTRIAQQSYRRRYKRQHHDLVFGRVSLETRSEDILLLLALAEAVA